MKRTLYPKLLAGYLMYGLIGFVIIATFTYHLTFSFLQRKEAASLYRESALISSEYAQNYFSQSITLEELQKQLTTLSTYLSGEIWIMDTRGNILLNTASSLDAEQERIKDFDVTDFGNSYYRVGDFYQTFSSEMLSVFSPITVNYKVRGYVIIQQSGILCKRSDPYFLSDTCIAVPRCIYCSYFIYIRCVHPHPKDHQGC